MNDAMGRREKMPRRSTRRQPIERASNKPQVEQAAVCKRTDRLHENARPIESPSYQTSATGNMGDFSHQHAPDPEVSMVKRNTAPKLYHQRKVHEPAVSTICTAIQAHEGVLSMRCVKHSVRISEWVGQVG
ncbi:hypothetical protein FKP32DRAFT_1286211 [Trametes sanguinea]|nr:hypothetical protein FKP32DRAFT_1286211 [Trametes sanguinea]